MVSSTVFIDLILLFLASCHLVQLQQEFKLHLKFVDSLASQVDDLAGYMLHGSGPMWKHIAREKKNTNKGSVLRSGFSHGPWL
jgi:hypothetical protein